MEKWYDDFKITEEDTIKKIQIKRDLFDYKDNFKENPIGGNSFVADLETYRDIENDVKPITTIISYSHLSYLKKQTVKDRRKPIPEFTKEFEGKVLDIVNDTDSNLSDEEKEIQLYKKFFDDMISITKKKSTSLNNRIIIFMFNNSRYDNSYFLKVLVRLGYTQTLDNKFHRDIKNQKQIDKFNKKIEDIKKQIEEYKQLNIPNEKDIELLEEEIKDIKKHIKNITVEDKTKYKNEYVLLANDSVQNLSLKFTYKNYIFELKDMCNFLKTKLATLGDIVGEKKLKDIGFEYFSLDYKTLTPEQWKEYKLYAEMDVKILWLAGKKYSNLIEFDNPNILTISSLSLHQWKKLEYQNKPYYRIDYVDWEIGNESYRGGFSFVNEKFLNKRLSNVHSYDINSSYPSSMMNNLPYEEISEEEISDEVKNGYVAKLYHIIFKNFKIKEDMIPIIPNKTKSLNNSFYKDYNRDKALEIHKMIDSKNVWTEFEVWLWDKELEWFEKFYNDMDYEILETKYFKTKRLFSKYINHFYIQKAQSDVDKILCGLIKQYFNNRDINQLNEDKKIEFDKYFNEKNDLLEATIPFYWESFCNTINKYVNIIDNLKTEKQIKEFTNDLENQLIYLETVRNTTKLYLNTLYGKFGMKPNQESYIHLSDKLEKGDIVDIEVNPLTKETYTYKITAVKQHKILDKYVYSTIRVDKDKKKANNVFIASYITMLSRNKLYEVLHRYTNKSVLYGDTDSVKMFDYLDDSFVNNTALGKWKYEDTYKDFCYVGSKKYMYVNDKGKFDFKIAGVNQISDIYGDYKKSYKVQNDIMNDFVNNELKILKKGSCVDKDTGEKVIKDKSTEIQLSQKDVDKQFISIDKQHKSLIEAGYTIKEQSEDYDWSIFEGDNKS